MSKSQLKKNVVPKERFITRNTHVKYKRSHNHSSKVISKVKVSERKTE